MHISEPRADFVSDDREIQARINRLVAPPGRRHIRPHWVREESIAATPPIDGKPDSMNHSSESH